MRRSLLILFLLVSGVSMAAPGKNPLEVLEVGGYSQIASRPNPQMNEIVFIPSLSALLVAAERKAGRPLVEAEVKAVRDNATVTVTPPLDHKSGSTIRAYEDIHPSNVWEEWLKLRRSLPRK
jgi:hypothetical protein